MSLSADCGQNEEKEMMDLEKVDMILNLVHPKIYQELKFQDDCIYPEEMLETLE